jgi:hypothetical protein
MMRSIERRVAALEESAGGGGDGCGYCGGGGDDDRDGPYEVYFEDEQPEDPEETCPQCGRELITYIYFDDDPRAPNVVGKLR